MLKFKYRQCKDIGGRILKNEHKPYHHKDLRKALIEFGIELVASQGIQAFSLRKVAASCGVSHSAPYSHFQNKDELLSVMQQHITDQFVDVLQETISKHKHERKLIDHLGIAYLSFFLRNPHYFSFLYMQSNIQIDISSPQKDIHNYKPFEIYKEILMNILEEQNYPKEKQLDVIVAMWSFVHGVTALSSMNNVPFTQDWEQKIVDYMELFDCSFLDNKEKNI